MSIYTPYSYLIGWSHLNKWYYGVRYALKTACLYESGCHPDELWKTYYTSSNVVKRFREKNGDPDVIQIRKTFTDKNEAIIWENKVLKRLKVVSSEKWLNCTDNFALTHDIHPKGMLDKKHTKESKIKIGNSMKGFKHSNESNKKKSDRMKGEGNPMFGVKGDKHPRYGKTHTNSTKELIGKRNRGENSYFYGKKRPDHSEKMSGENHFNFGKKTKESTKSKISETLKNKSLKKCSYCDYEHRNNGILARYHNENCKHKPE